MARADSTIRVNILGDAKSLQKAAATSEGAIGGLNKKLVAAGGVLAGAFAADALVDFGNTALKEADRVGDATSRLEGQLGDLAQPLIDAADEFSNLGASEGDMLELEARIIDIGTAAGISSPKLADLADDAAAAAAMAALMTDVPADEWISKIGKAASSGDMRALRDLGINLDEAAVNARALADTGKPTADALTEGELAAARLALIVETLTGRYGDATAAGGDFAQKQDILGAKWETLTGNIGKGLEGPLNDLLGWILTGIDGWALLSDRIGGFDKAIEDALTPVARMIDLQRTLIGVIAEAIEQLNTLLGMAGQFDIGNPGGGTPRRPPSRNRGAPGTVTVNVQGGSPEAIEQAVRTAIRHASGRGPLGGV